MSGRSGSARRAAILRAAVRLFALGQYHGTAIPTLAAAAGVAEGTIYNHFRNKEELALAALRESAAELEAALLERLPQRGAGLEQLAFAAVVLLGAAEEDLERARFVFCVDHSAYLGPAADDADGLSTLVGLLIASAAAHGETRDLPPALLVRTWRSVIAAAVAERVSGGLAQPLGEIADRVAEMAVSAIRR